MTLILGVDPGSRITGYGLIEKKNHMIRYIDSGCIRARDNSLPHRLSEIQESFFELLTQYSPQTVAIEEVFVNKNIQSALKLSHARGVIMAIAALQGAAVFEYSARAVKQALVGYGAAEKTQVRQMVMQFLALNKTPQSDAGDALAIAIYHARLLQGKLLGKI